MIINVLVTRRPVKIGSAVQFGHASFLIATWMKDPPGAYVDVFLEMCIDTFI